MIAVYKAVCESRIRSHCENDGFVFIEVRKFAAVET